MTSSSKHKPSLAAYTVSYDSKSHWSVLSQLHGSIWLKVLPYCIFNVLLTLLLTCFDRSLVNAKHFLEISNQGHSFLSIVVAFLLVSRVNIALGRYNEARNYLGVMYRETRELVQTATVFSIAAIDESAVAWRHEVAYRSLLLLRTAMAVINYPTTQCPAWQVPELNGIERDEIVQAMTQGARWAHAERSEWEVSMRVPVRVAYLLRKTIHSNLLRLADPAYLQVNQENKLLQSVDVFMGGYYGIQGFLMTPVPFPLVQMARMFLFFYVFTVPFVLIGDSSSVIAHCCQAFVLTYGFVGLELVAIELDDPFGDDANDFNNLAVAKIAFEDTYLTILDVDGMAAADRLRHRMEDPNLVQVVSEESWLLKPSATFDESGNVRFL
ncbi:hypothetical protein FisN_14Hh245 [Fistulifera solaris]|uniref:Bestrophin homolog n=1 Tax=Fistulifera solaris TaxID=1519565 RepID=A0A1Z5K8X5_FISSO|nr:hypothetical protein FisN_14Hh245 [Fistulifera solaris]|eukprot:GAX22612.1 hypothetical protein FisN_14Hh245 [Fistulifera solaris]